MNLKLAIKFNLLMEKYCHGSINYTFPAVLTINLSNEIQLSESYYDES